MLRQVCDTSVMLPNINYKFVHAENRKISVSRVPSLNISKCDILVREKTIHICEYLQHTLFCMLIVWKAIA